METEECLPRRGGRGNSRLTHRGVAETEECLPRRGGSGSELSVAKRKVSPPSVVGKLSTRRGGNGKVAPPSVEEMESNSPRRGEMEE